MQAVVVGVSLRQESIRGRLRNLHDRNRTFLTPYSGSAQQENRK